MKKSSKWLVGLTGSIASGKSTALKQLAELGAYTISADDLVRELYQVPSIRLQLKKWFGSAEPSVVADAVFRCAITRQKVEDFLHPRVWKLAQKKLAANSQTWAVFEVPLLLEAGWDKKMDLTVLVSASEKTLSARLQARNLSHKEYQARRQTQLPEAEKIRRADVVILNDGTKKDLQQKMSRLYNACNHLYQN